MPERSSRGLERLLRSGHYALPVLALLAVWILALYRQALTLGVLSDGWVLLEIGSRGLRRAPFVLLGYHTIPVTHLFNAVLWKLFHLHETAYQLLNLAEMGLAGWLIYLLGCALFKRPRVALVAALLFLANSSFYEVSCWSVVGNFQSLAAIFYLGGIFAVHRALRSPRPAGWAALFALCVLLAFFTYEPAVSLLPVGLLQAVLVPAKEKTSGWSDWTIRSLIRRLRPFVLPAGAVALVVGISKILTSASGHQAMFLPKTLDDLKLRIYLLVRGCIAIFTLRGSDSKLYFMLSFGTAPGAGTILHKLLVGSWALGLAATAALFMARSRTPAVRFLVAWFAVHMLIVSAATGIVSRMFYLGAIPAALLSSYLLWRGAEVAASALGRRLAILSTEGVTVGLVFFTLALLVSGATTDLDLAARIHREATIASRQTVDLARKGLAAGARQVVLVNFPAALARDGVSSFAFVNGLTEELALKTGGGVSRPWLAHTYAAAPDGRFANGSQPLSLAGLDRLAADPETQVLAFDAKERMVKELDRITWRLPAAYTASSAPYLDWQTGDWPWFRVYGGEPLELPFAAGGSTWVAVRYLWDATTAFAVQAGSLPPVEVAGRAGAGASWPTVTLPLPPSDAGPSTVTIQPRSEVWLAGVWSFAPPAAYTPESAPFLHWLSRPFPAFTLEGPVDLPLSPTNCPGGTCAVHLEVLAEPGRDLAVSLAGGAVQTLSFDGVKTPEWREVVLPVVDPGRTAVVRFEPRGRLAPEVRRLAWAP